MICNRATSDKGLVESIKNDHSMNTYPIQCSKLNRFMGRTITADIIDLALKITNSQYDFGHCYGHFFYTVINYHDAGQLLHAKRSDISINIFFFFIVKSSI